MSSRNRNAQVELGDKTWEPGKVTESDFAAGKDEGTSLSAGEIGEVLIAEVEDNNDVGSKLASYDRVWLGQRPDATMRGPRGKIFGILRDGTPAELPPDTEFRVIARPKNESKRRELTDWIFEADLNVSNPSDRYDLPPVRNKDGDPVIVKEGRVIGIEVRNQSSSVTFSRSDTSLRLPALFGY